MRSVGFGGVLFVFGEAFHVGFFAWLHLDRGRCFLEIGFLQNTQMFCFLRVPSRAEGLRPHSRTSRRFGRPYNRTLRLSVTESRIIHGGV